MRIYIPEIEFEQLNRKRLFLLVRPFLNENGWGNDAAIKQRWDVPQDYVYCDSVVTADVYFIPNAINTYSQSELREINRICEKQNIKAYGYVTGDFGEEYAHLPNIIHYRMGGFKSQLNSRNRSFFVPLSDHLFRVYGTDDIIIREKKQVPTVSFCGFANVDRISDLTTYCKLIMRNIGRFVKSPLRRDYEPLFSAPTERLRLLKSIENYELLHCNFVYRNEYRANNNVKEYFDNILHSDYVICIRGAGNFSVRFYETLLMGRIPVFVNTDCMLPFEDQINWKDHLVWVEWRDRHRIAEIIDEFHQRITPQEFRALQIQNRQLWKTTLSVKNTLCTIQNDI